MDKKDFFEGNEQELKREFLKNLKVRSIEQKFLYFGDGTEMYYECSKNNVSNQWDPQAARNLLSNLITKEEKICFISLGCGAAAQDTKIMDLLCSEQYQFTWIGVDSSPAMIQRTQNTLKDSQFAYELWVEDITSYDFYTRTLEKISQFDKVIFMFLGGTIGNMIQTEIIDTLYNLMKPEHLLWFDCAIRQSNDKMQNLNFFSKYAQFLQNENRIKYMFHPLEIIGVPFESGSLMLENIIEESIGVLNFRYSFKFKEPCTVHFLDEYVHFIPPEKVKLLEIRAYYPETMIKYLDQHDLQLVDSITQDLYGQFIFQKTLPKVTTN